VYDCVPRDPFEPGHYVCRTITHVALYRFPPRWYFLYYINNDCVLMTAFMIVCPETHSNLGGGTRCVARSLMLHYIVFRRDGASSVCAYRVTFIVYVIIVLICFCIITVYMVYTHSSSQVPWNARNIRSLVRLTFRGMLGTSFYICTFRGMLGTSDL